MENQDFISIMMVNTNKEAAGIAAFWYLGGGTQEFLPIPPSSGDQTFGVFLLFSLTINLRSRLPGL